HSSGGKANSAEASGPGGGPPTFAAQNIPGRYIVVLQPDADVTGRVAALEAQHGFRASHVYQAALKGFAATLPDAAVAAIRQDPDVILVEPDQIVRAFPQSIPTGITRMGANQNATAN